MRFAGGLELAGAQLKTVCADIGRHWGVADLEEVERKATPEDIAGAFSRLERLPVLRDLPSAVDPALLAGVDRSLLRAAGGLPVSRDGPLLTLGLVNPYNTLLPDRCPAIWPGCDVQIVIVPAEDFQAWLDETAGAADGPAATRAELEAMEVYTQGEAAKEFDLDGDGGGLAERQMRAVFAEAVRLRASDVHMAVERGRFYWEMRVNGDIEGERDLPEKAWHQFESFLIQLAGQPLETRREPSCSGRFSLLGSERKIDVRFERHATLHGCHMAMRLQDMASALPQFGVGGLEIGAGTRAAIDRLLSAPEGLVVISGPTGSGKSTTLYAMIREINRPRYNILSLENPVECEIPGVKQTNLRDVRELKRYLASFMRSDPDIMLIAEVRDNETAELAAEAASTGHLVFTTLHTNSAAQILDRFQHLGVPRWKVASTIIGACAQRLVKVLCSCKVEAGPPGDAERALYGLDERWASVPVHRAREGGCQACRQTGYSGRRALLEVIPMTRDLREMVEREGCTSMDIEAAAYQKHGVVSVRRAGLDLVERGVTDLASVADVVLLTLE